MKQPTPIGIVHKTSPLGTLRSMGRNLQSLSILLPLVVTATVSTGCSHWDIKGAFSGQPLWSRADGDRPSPAGEDTQQAHVTPTLDAEAVSDQRLYHGGPLSREEMDHLIAAASDAATSAAEQVIGEIVAEVMADVVSLAVAEAVNHAVATTLAQAAQDYHHRNEHQERDAQLTPVTGSATDHPTISDRERHHGVQEDNLRYALAPVAPGDEAELSVSEGGDHDDDDDAPDDGDPDQDEGDGDGTYGDRDHEEQEEGQEEDSLWLAQLSDEDIVELLRDDPEALGPMSLGRINAGAVYNGVQMPADSEEKNRWVVLRPHQAYGTQETVNFIISAIETVHEQFPETHPLVVGNISTRQGGRLGRHLSHQSGRDVDLGWYFTDGDHTWYRHATDRKMDLARNWAMIRAFVTETDLEMAFVDRRVQVALFNYALAQGEDETWLRSVFQHPNGRPDALVRHARGHASHIHVRFYNRESQEVGRRAYPHMVRMGMIKPPTYFVNHRVRADETLGHMAVRYRTTVRAIQRANNMGRSTLIRAGHTYRIPQRGGVSPAQPIRIPPRRLPPEPPAPPEQVPVA